MDVTGATVADLIRLLADLPDDLPLWTISDSDNRCDPVQTSCLPNVEEVEEVAALGGGTYFCSVAIEGRAADRSIRVFSVLNMAGM